MIIGLLIWVGCIIGCYKIAENNGRNTGLAIILGILFGFFALIGYLIAGKKS